MAKSRDRRPTNENRRLALRLGAVAAGYIAYRLVVPESLPGAILLGLGVWLGGVSRIERNLNPAPTERQQKLQLIGPRVALAMIVVGAVLAVI